MGDNEDEIETALRALATGEIDNPFDPRLDALDRNHGSSLWYARDGSEDPAWLSEALATERAWAETHAEVAKARSALACAARDGEGSGSVAAVLRSTASRLREILREAEAIDRSTRELRRARAARYADTLEALDERRAALQPPIPPEVLARPATLGFSIDMGPGQPPVAFTRAARSNGSRCRRCGSYPVTSGEPVLEEGDQAACLSCLAEMAAGRRVEGDLPEPCPTCGGSGGKTAPEDPEVELTCVACGGSGIGPPREPRAPAFAGEF